MKVFASQPGFGVLSESMCGLSNIFWWRDGLASDPPTEIRPPEPHEIEPAIRLLLGFNGEKADESVARDFIQYSRPRGINLESLIVAVSGKHLLACCLPVHSPGKSSLIMTSTSGRYPGQEAAVSDCLQAAIRRLDPSDTSLVQLLIDPADQPVIERFRQIGFRDLATLIYLQRAINRNFPMPSFPEGIELIQYNQRNHNLFARAILASYENSLDCPDLHGKRNIEDIIAGHQAAGEFTPDLWYCLIKDRSPAGVLLLSPSPPHSTLELVYIGLAPQARGQKLGDSLLQLALFRTSELGMNIFTLAVDSINHPAMQLYFRHGLAEVHRRHAMMLILNR